MSVEKVLRGMQEQLVFYFVSLHLAFVPFVVRNSAGASPAVSISSH